MSFVCLSDLECRAGGSGLSTLVSGWSEPEPDFVWALGLRSRILLDIPSAHPSYLLILSLKTIDQTQMVSFWTNGTLIQTFPADDRHGVSIMFPYELVVNGRIDLTFAHYNAVKISEAYGGKDQRVVSVAVSRLTLYGTDQRLSGYASNPSDRLPLKELFDSFHSLGDNCEFGFCQRRFGSERLHFLRFSGISLPQLTFGLVSGFQDLAKRECISYWLDGPQDGPVENLEYMIRHSIYGLNSHSFRSRGSMSGEDFITQTQKRLEFLQRKFLEDLEDGDKIYVVKREQALSWHEVMPIWTTLRSYGDNTLLYVVKAAGDRTAGTVERKGAGLLCGYIDAFVPPHDINDVSEHCWISICRKAHHLWLQERASAA